MSIESREEEKMEVGDTVTITGNKRLGGDHRGKSGTIVRLDPNSSWGKSWYVLLAGYTTCLSFLESELLLTGHVSDEPEAFGVFPAARKHLPENQATLPLPHQKGESDE